MGTQTMGSQGGGGSSDGGAVAARGGAGSGRIQGQKSHALARQGSLYSLTLDEVQHQLGDLGKPLSSMNLDELLKNVWTAEANQEADYGAVAAVAAAQQSQLAASVSSLSRQSSLSLSRDLSKKTVDEVWQDIQQGQQQSNRNIHGQKAAHDRQPTLGEMTLEDFLVKAGVVAKPSPGKKNPGPVLGDDPIALPVQGIPQPAQWMHYQIPSQQQQQNQQQQQQQQQQNMLAVFMPGHPVQQTLPMVANPIMDVAYPENQMSMSPSALMGTLSDTPTPGRKRVAPGEVVERTVERRQKRMIKNRESAARSRARKQAYTHELENKVSRLEEENERLKRLKEVEKVLPCVLHPEPKYQLRRTSSAPL